MKKWEITEINGERFEVNTDVVVTEAFLYGYDDIHHAYGRPSHTKEVIWETWEEWFINNDGYCCIASRNSSFFSIAGYVTDLKTGTRYYCYITASHNKAWTVV